MPNEQLILPIPSSDRISYSPPRDLASTCLILSFSESISSINLPASIRSFGSFRNRDYLDEFSKAKLLWSREVLLHSQKNLDEAVVQVNSSTLLARLCLSLTQIPSRPNISQRLNPLTRLRKASRLCRRRTFNIECSRERGRATRDKASIARVGKQHSARHFHYWLHLQSCLLHYD